MTTEQPETPIALEKKDHVQTLAIIENDADLAMLMKMTAEMEGWRVITITRDFEQWADHAAWQRYGGIDAAIVDYFLKSPVNGCVLAQAAKRMGVRTVVLTAAPHMANEDSACKGVDVVTKSVTAPTLIALLKVSEQNGR